MLYYKKILAYKVSDLIKDLFEAEKPQEVVDTIDWHTEALEEIRAEILEDEDSSSEVETEYEKLKRELGQ